MAAADQTEVDYSDGRLLVKVPKRRRVLGPSSDSGSVDVAVDLPAGSHVHVNGSGSVAAFCGEGRLGECRIHTGIGDIQLDQAGSLDAGTTGTITVNHVTGDVEARTGSGRIHLGRIGGSAKLKNTDGDSWVGDITGELRCQAAGGDIIVDTARAGVTANSARGAIRVGGLTRGSAWLKTAAGEIEIGISTGTAAYLDVHTKFGRVHNKLEDAEDPAPSEETVDVRACTSYGDITAHRSSTHHNPAEERP